MQLDIPPYHAIVCCIDNQRMAVKVMLTTSGIGYAIVVRDSLRPVGAVAALADLLRQYPANS